MAKVVDQIPLPPNSPTRHDFAKYMDGQIWELEQGIDFTCSVESMRRQANRYAIENGLKGEMHQNAKAGKVWIRRL